MPVWAALDKVVEVFTAFLLMRMGESCNITNLISSPDNKSFWRNDCHLLHLRSTCMFLGISTLWFINKYNCEFTLSILIG